MQRRFASKYEMPYEYEVLQEIKNSDSDIIFDLEIAYKRLFKNFKYLPQKDFGGKTECFNIDVKEKIISVNLTN